MAAANAHGDNSSFDAVTLHCVEESSVLNGTGRADWVTVGNRVTFNIHDVLGQSEVAYHGKGDCGEGLVSRFSKADVLAEKRHGRAGPSSRHQGPGSLSPPEPSVAGTLLKKMVPIGSSRRTARSRPQKERVGSLHDLLKGK